MNKLIIRIFLGLIISVAVVFLILPACGLIGDSDPGTDVQTVKYGDELITNGDFSSNINWIFYLDSSSLAKGDGAIINEEYVMQMTQLSQSDSIKSWHGALKYTGQIPLLQGSTYEVSFDAKATANVELSAVLTLNKDPWTYYGGVYTELTTQMTTYSSEFLMNCTDDTIPSLTFNIGNHLEKVTVDNISIKQKIYN